MRITSNAVSNNIVNNLDDRYSQLANLQEEIATGKQLLKPSDGPSTIAEDLGLRSDLAGLTQYKSNMDDGLSWMSVTDSSMSSMNDLLQRMRELAVQGASDTLTAAERTTIDAEVEQLTRQMYALVNTTYKGDYVFGGTQTKIPPYQTESSTAASAQDYGNLKMAYYNAGGMAVGSTVQLQNAFDNSNITNIIPGSFKLVVAGTTYQENVDYTVDYAKGTITILNPALLQDVTPTVPPGTPGTPYSQGQFAITFDYLTTGKDIYGNPVSNEGAVSRQIEKNVTTQINVPADEAWVDSASGTTMIGTLEQFGQDLLQNNQAGIANAITSIDKVSATLQAAQSKNGARMNRFQETETRNGNQTITTTSQQSNLEDADMASTVTNYTNTQNVYQAALSSAAKILQESLANFLS